MWKDRTRVKSESGRSVAALTSFRPFGISDEKRVRPRRTPVRDGSTCRGRICLLTAGRRRAFERSCGFFAPDAPHRGSRAGPRRRGGADHAQSGRCSGALRVRSPAPAPLIRRCEDRRGSGYRSGNAGQEARSWRDSADTSSLITRSIHHLLHTMGTSKVHPGPSSIRMYIIK